MTSRGIQNLVISPLDDVRRACSRAESTIGRKLALIGAMFALPLAFLVYSLVAEKNIAIDFARAEISGNHFLAAADDRADGPAAQHGGAPGRDRRRPRRPARRRPAPIKAPPRRSRASRAPPGISPTCRWNLRSSPRRSTPPTAFLADARNSRGRQLASRHAKARREAPRPHRARGRPVEPDPRSGPPILSTPMYARQS